MNREAVPDLQPNVAAGLCWEWKSGGTTMNREAVLTSSPTLPRCGYVGSWITNANYRERFLTSSPTLPQAYVGNGKGRNHNEPRSGP